MEWRWQLTSMFANIAHVGCISARVNYTTELRMVGDDVRASKNCIYTWKTLAHPFSPLRRVARQGDLHTILHLDTVLRRVCSLVARAPHPIVFLLAVFLLTVFLLTRTSCGQFCSYGCI